MDLKKVLIIAVVFMVIMIPVSALRMDKSINSDRQIFSSKPVNNNLNVTVHANKYYTGKFNSKNAKTYTITNNPKNGKLTLNKNGEFTYKPNKNFVGKDIFKYKFYNGKKYSNILTVSISVTNHLPVSKDICTTTHANIKYNGKLADLDVDKDLLTYKIKSDSKNGIINLNSNGVYSYTPNNNFVGVDSFSYISNDGIGNSKISTVTIDVTNHAPIANDINAQIHSNSKYEGKLNGKDIDGDKLTYTNVSSQPNHGILTLNQNGTYSFLPFKNFVGIDSFDYKTNDGMNDSNTAKVTINITNSPPVSNNISIKAFANTQYIGKFNATDPDHDDLIYSYEDGPSYGNLKIKSDGTFVYMPRNGFRGEDSFVYRVSDGFKFSDKSRVTITVLNNIPVAHNQNISTVRNTECFGKINISDIDNDKLMVDYIKSPSNGTLSANPDGSFVYFPKHGFIGVDSFSYVILDGADRSNEATVTITVSNKPPVAKNITYNILFSTFDKGGFSGKLDGKGYNGRPVTYKILNKSYFAQDIILGENGQFQYISGARFVGFDNFTYQVNDGFADSNIATVTIKSTMF